MGNEWITNPEPETVASDNVADDNHFNPLFLMSCAVAFIASILAANYLTTVYGMVPIGFGMVATAGTYFAGLTFVLRDLVQETGGRGVALALLPVGATLSYAVSDPQIATASAIAFLVSEVLDFAIYTPLRDRGYLRAAVASNVAGAIVDTLLFLMVAGYGLQRQAVSGQIFGKTLVTVAAVVAVLALRGVLAFRSMRRISA
jgi:uncharacterized PurR-regulated membrane protein YhhQ (DUF165 family)